MKIFYLDLETTGVRFWKNGIHQISGAIEIDGGLKEEFNFHVKPYKDALIEDEALKIANITREDLNDYSEMSDVYDQIVAMLGRYVNKYDKKDKFFIVAYNGAAFDVPFFRAFFKQNNDEYFGSWFWSVCLDVIVLAEERLKNCRADLKDFKLATVAAFLGISVDESRLHDAGYDIYLTRAIYHLLNTESYEYGYYIAEQSIIKFINAWEPGQINSHLGELLQNKFNELTIRTFN